MKQIDIDLDVHRLIENARLNFEESQNAILRRLLGIDRAAELTSGNQIPRGTQGVLFRRSSQQPNALAEQIASYQASNMSARLAGASTAVRDWNFGGATLPEGTKLQKFLKKKKVDAVIHNGAIYVNGEYHQSPSAAAMAVNGGVNVNGWDFWEYFYEVALQWNKLDILRKDHTND
jgi:hypothetical protein